MVFHWSMSKIQSPQISRTSLSMQGNFTHAQVWMVSACPIISDLSCPYNHGNNNNNNNNINNNNNNNNNKNNNNNAVVIVVDVFP